MYGFADAAYDLDQGQQKAEDRQFQTSEREHATQRRAIDEGYQDEQRDQSRLDWGDKETERKYQADKKVMDAAIGSFIATGGKDHTQLVEWFNKSNLQQGTDISDVKDDGKGGFVVTFNNGNSQPFTDMEEVASHLESFMSPENYLKDARSRKAEATKQQSAVDMQKMKDENAIEVAKIAAQGKASGASPAIIQEMQFYAKNLTAGDMQKAYDLSKRRKVSPEELYMKSYMQYRKENADNFGDMTDEQIREGVMAAMTHMADDIDALSGRKSAIPTDNGPGQQPAAGAVKPSQGAIDYLMKNYRSDPSLKSQFEAKFGKENLPEGI